MKMTKKKVVVAALAVILVAILSMGTLAWFNAQDQVTNEFKVLNSLTDFEVDVWEKVPDGVDADSEPDVIGKGDTSENSAVYDNVVPGKVYTKEVYVENTSNNTLTGQYIKMELTFTNYSALHAMIVDLADDEEEPAFDCTTMLQGANFSTEKDANELWWYDKENTIYNTEENSVTYVFYLKEVLDTEEYRYLFTGVKLPETMDINDADNLIKIGGFQIKAVAYAIQSANIADPKPEATVLDDVLYAFGEPWANRGDAPVPTYPSVD